MSSFLVSIVVSAALGAAASHASALDEAGLRRSLDQEKSSSLSNGSAFEQYFKDNAPKSTKDQEAVLLKKEQELLAAEQALLAKEQLLLKGSAPTDSTANSSTQAVKPPAVSEPQQENVVTERARLATPPMAPKEDVKTNQIKKKEPTPSSQAQSEPAKQISVEPPVQAVTNATKTSGIDVTNQQPLGNEPSQTKKEAPAKTEVAPVPAQQSASSEELEALRKRNSVLEQELVELRKRLASKERSVGEKDQTASQAVRELNETKARLMLAETQVERLSSIIEARNDCTISQLTGETRQRPAPAPAATSRLPVVPKVESSAEMPIATVVKKKVYLRTGPGKNNSPLMAVSEGTRLAVETMQGEWYRVITPTGARAWVAAESIAFGNGGKIAPARSSSAPSAVEQSEEDKAFELLKRR